MGLVIKATKLLVRGHLRKIVLQTKTALARQPKMAPLPANAIARGRARLSCFLKFDVNESSFSGSKVELQAASFDLLVYSVESLTKRGGESGRGVEDIGKLGAE